MLGQVVQLDRGYWEDLWRRHPSAFDVVLCRGSSRIYAGTWEDDARLRSWTTRISSPETSYSFHRYSHYLPHEELVDLFTRAGLSDLRPLEVPAEHYQVFTGARGR